MLSPTVGKRVRLVFALLVLLALMLPIVRFARGSHPTVAGLPLAGKTFAIDPGHGGYDPGVIKDNIDEKKVVLEISLALRDYLQSAGARVVMTREIDKDLLVLPTAGPKKRQDMKNRLFIIRQAEPDMLISVHANAISSSRWRGAQVFYCADSDDSRVLAEIMQQELTRVLANTDRQAKTGNYLLLHEMDVPTVIVEVGFISNPEERRLLETRSYQSKVAWSIYLGIMRYYAQNTENPS
jgi:N-acetylmuramoyl-L-alanine amidase